MKQLLPYLPAVLAAALLALFEGDMLWQLQEQNLFLHTALFFEQQMVKAGGLLTWAACYLTQFFYYPALGAGLLCLLWVLLIFLIRKAFRIPSSWSVVTLVPVACLLLTIVDLGYWTYYLKLPGHPFCATLGSIVAMGLAWLYRLLPQRFYLPILFMLFSTVIGYPLFGFYGLWATMLMAVMGITSGRHRGVTALTALLAIVFVPLVCYYLLYHETNMVNIYWTALPVYALSQETYPAYYLPYVVLVGSTVLMAIAGTQASKASGGNHSSGRGNHGSQPLALNSLLSKALVLVCTAGCVALFWYKDANFHCEQAMSRQLAQQEWAQMVETGGSVGDEPTRAVCMMRNLALFRLGRQGEEMFRYPNGAKRPDAPFSLRMVHTVGKQLYLRYGVTNYCYRWCMEDGVEYGWNVAELKMMAVCSLLNGEPVAAQRFLNMLKKTDFHRSWARRYEPCISAPQLMLQDKELQTIVRLQPRDNFLTADMSQMERFLIEHFSTANADDPLMVEQTMIAAMQSKNMQLFWQQLYIYTEKYCQGRLPRHYQEAACLFGHLMNIDVSHMPFDRQVVQDYQDFAGTVGGYQRQGMSVDQIRPLVYNRFHTTYYYDYYFNRYQYIEQ